MRLTIEVPDLSTEQAFDHIVRRVQLAPKRDTAEADLDRAALIVVARVLQAQAAPPAVAEDTAKPPTE